MRPWRRQCADEPRWAGRGMRPPYGADDVRRRRFFRRFAFVAVAVVLFGLWGVFTLVWSAATRFGIVDAASLRVPFFLVASWFAGLVLVTFLRIGRRIAVPLRAVMDAADRVAGGDYTTRVDVHGPPPVRALARAFNTMTERLERNDERRRNLMADVAHELRTPLTIIQGRVEGLLDGIYPRDDAGLQVVLEETRVLSRLIEDLRTLALSEAGALRLEKEPTDVAALAREVATALSGDAAARQVSIEVRDDAHTSIAIDPFRIREVLTNVIANAVRHSTAGGIVTVAVTAAPQGEAATGVVVAIIDTGAGMTPEQTARVFDRFYKDAESRGSGLGLSIARSLVAAHGGAISIDSAPSRGTTITFTLPGDQPSLTA